MFKATDIFFLISLGFSTKQPTFSLKLFTAEDEGVISSLDYVSVVGYGILLLQFDFR